MRVPNTCPLPPEGKLAAWCRRDFCGGAWLVLDSTGRIITQYYDPWRAARHVNGHV